VAEDGETDGAAVGVHSPVAVWKISASPFPASSTVQSGISVSAPFVDGASAGVHRPVPGS
jgi:hypothetical protein